MAQPFQGQNISGMKRVDQPTPNPLDKVLVGLLQSNVDDYVAQIMGTPPPEGVDPEYFLTQQIPVDWSHVQRTYAKDRTLENTYNYSISYDGEDNTKPTFTRDYIVRRSLYTPNLAPYVKAQPLLGIYVARVTNGGSGYDQKTVSVVLSGGAGSGGSIQAVVSNGAVTHLVVTSEGNYTVAPTITINGGTGATGTAFIQPQDAILVKEDMVRTPDSPLDGMYVLVRRVYVTLPGAVVTVSDETDKTSGQQVITTKQKRLISDITTGLVITPGVSVVETEMKEIEGSDVMAYEVKTTVLEGPWHDVASAKITYETRPQEFPGYLLSINDTVMVVDLYGTAVGHRKASADNAVCIKREWWVIDNEIPEVDYGTPVGNDVHVDRIIPGDIVVNGVPYRHVLHDDAIRDYGAAIEVPATTPSASEYYGTVALDDDPFAPGDPPKWIGFEKVLDADIIYYKIVSDGCFQVTTLSFVMQ